MDLRRWPHADALLDEALELPLRDREAFVRRASAGDAELADALSAVLREAAKGDAFLRPGGALSGALLADIVGPIGPPASVRAPKEAGPQPTPAPERRPWAFAVPFFLTLAVGGIIGAAGTLVLRGGADRTPSLPTSLAIPLPVDDVLVTEGGANLALARDGRTLVYRARRDGVSRLFVRQLERQEARPLAQTEDAAAPFVSASGRAVGFTRAGALHVMQVDGAPARRVAQAPGGVSGTWLGDAQVVFGGPNTQGLRRVAAHGGPLQVVTTADGARGEVAHVEPEALGDNRRVVFTILSQDGEPQLALTELDAGDFVRLGEGRQARLVAPDRLVFLRGGRVWTAGLDAARLRFAGEPRLALDDVEVNAAGLGQFAAAPGGTLVHVPRRDADTGTVLAWIDRRGRETPVHVDASRFERAALSPDATRVALWGVREPHGGAWVHDLRSGVTTRLALDPVDPPALVWAPGGRDLFAPAPEEPGAMVRVRDDGTAAGRWPARSGAEGDSPAGTTPDGRALLVTTTGGGAEGGIATIQLAPPHSRTVLLDGPGREDEPSVSPDGRWLAYRSNESGRDEIYVRPYPEVARGQWRVSVRGGRAPRWSPDGRELLFLADGAIQRVIVQAGSTFRTGVPERVVAIAGGAWEDDALAFDVSPEGQRFLVVRRAGAAPPFLSIVQGWRGP